MNLVNPHSFFIKIKSKIALNLFKSLKIDDNLLWVGTLYSDLFVSKIKMERLWALNFTKLLFLRKIIGTSLMFSSKITKIVNFSLFRHKLFLIRSTNLSVKTLDKIKSFVQFSELKVHRKANSKKSVFVKWDRGGFVSKVHDLSVRVKKSSQIEEYIKENPYFAMQTWCFW